MTLDLLILVSPSGDTINNVVLTAGWLTLMQRRGLVE